MENQAIRIVNVQRAAIRAPLGFKEDRTATQRAIPSFSPSHLHLAGLHCPVCDQPISNDKADQVQERMDARERAASEAVSLKLREQFASERAQLEANAQGALETVRRESASALDAFSAQATAREQAAREDAARTVREAAQRQIDLLTTANAELQYHRSKD